MNMRKKERSNDDALLGCFGSEKKLEERKIENSPNSGRPKARTADRSAYKETANDCGDDDDEHEI